MIADILIVDDNPIQAETRKAILSRAGRVVSVATDPLAALHLLREHHANGLTVSLVITDHSMPLMNGPRFVAMLRNMYPDLPVVVLSGFHDVEAEYDNLNVTHRTKPISPDELILLVDVVFQNLLDRTA